MPFDRSRYPKDWKAISLRIRARSGGQCECMGECGLHRTHPGARRCTERDREPARWARGKVMLTVAHLRSATELPFSLHVTRTAEADEVVELVGFLVPRPAEGLEGDLMVHGRAFAELRAGASADNAAFIVALPRGTSGAAPCRAVGGLSAAAPVWIALSCWRLLGEPAQAADIAAETASVANVEAADAVLAPAALADADTEATLRAAAQFVATGRRTSLAAIAGLLDGQWEHRAAYGAGALGRTAALRAADARPLSSRDGSDAQSASALDGAGLPSPSLGVVHESRTARFADDVQRTLAGTSHGLIYHIGYLIENVRDENLRAFCNRCHLRYDVDHHKKNASATRMRRKEERGQLALGGTRR